MFILSLLLNGGSLFVAGKRTQVELSIAVWNCRIKGNVEETGMRQFLERANLAAWCILKKKERGRPARIHAVRQRARCPMPLTFHVGNRGTGNRGTDKNGSPLSCGRDAHAPFFCCPQRSAGILPAGAETAPPPYCPGSADVLVGKKYGAGSQGRRGRRRSQEISPSLATSEHRLLQPAKRPTHLPISQRAR